MALDHDSGRLGLRDVVQLLRDDIRDARAGFTVDIAESEQRVMKRLDVTSESFLAYQIWTMIRAGTAKPNATVLLLRSCDSPTGLVFAPSTSQSMSALSPAGAGQAAAVGHGPAEFLNANSQRRQRPT
jgi:hypothetical protein